MCAVEEVKKKYVRMAELQEAQLQDQLSNSVTLINSLLNSKVSKEELVWDYNLKTFQAGEV